MPTSDACIDLNPYTVARSHHRRRRVSLLLVIVAVTLLSMMDHRWLSDHEPDAFDHLHGHYVTVAEVRGADVLVIHTPGWLQPLTTVRLMGIEGSNLTALRPMPEPAMAAGLEITRALVLGQQVQLRLEPHQITDRQGRLLAHVILADGRSLVEPLLKSGLAQVDRHYSHTLVEQYETLHQSARVAGRGLWNRAPHMSTHE